MVGIIFTWIKLSILIAKMKNTNIKRSLEVFKNMQKIKMYSFLLSKNTFKKNCKRKLWFTSKIKSDLIKKKKLEKERKKSRHNNSKEDWKNKDKISWGDSEIFKRIKSKVQQSWHI